MLVAPLRPCASGHEGRFRRAALVVCATLLAALATSGPVWAVSVRFVQAPPDGAVIVAGQSGVRFEIYWTIDTSECGPLATPYSRVYLRGPLPDGPEVNTALLTGVTDLQAAIEVSAPASPETYGYRVGLRCWPLRGEASSETRTFRVLPDGSPTPTPTPTRLRLRLRLRRRLRLRLRLRSIPTPTPTPTPTDLSPPPQDSPPADTISGDVAPSPVGGSMLDNALHTWVERVVRGLRAHRFTSRSRAQRVRAYQRLRRDAGYALAVLRATHAGRPLASCTITALRHVRDAAALGLGAAVRHDGRAAERRIARRTVRALNRLEACL